MTIKRRLVISNILMIIIPVVIALAVSFAGIALAWSAVKKGDGKSADYITHDEVSDLVMRVIDGKADSQALEKTLASNHANVVVYDEAGNMKEFGCETLRYRQALLDTVQAIGGEGFASVGDEELFAEKRTENGVDYTVCMLNHVTDAYYAEFDTGIAAVSVITIFSVILAVIISNHFLTRFVFRKIEYSLEVLSGGVHEISAGNLDYRITYDPHDEFTPICEDFNHMSAQLKQSVELTRKQDQSRKELLAGIAHDLRSPLTSIRAYIEGLLDDVPKTPNARMEYMQTIKTKADDIDHMVSKLFLFSQMELGEYPCYPELLDLKQEITSYVDAMREEYAAKGLRLTVNPIGSGINIFADPVQVRSVLANILENSLKYKDKEQAETSISARRIGETVRILIEDNGPGVPDEALGKLFDVFYRRDPSRSNPQKGSGLGLAITAKAISQMGGTIYAENREQKGLRMVIVLPLASEEEKNEKNTDH